VIAFALMRFCRLPLGQPARYNPANLCRAVRRSGTHDKAYRLK